MKWASYQVRYRYRSTIYHITVQSSGGGTGVRSVMVNGIDQQDMAIHLVDDKGEHQVIVKLGE